MRENEFALGPIVAVCLGSGMTAGGAASETTLLRANAAADLAKANPTLTVILSGDGRKETDPAKTNLLKTEAAIMAEILTQSGISSDRLLLEDESRDTIGNAILTTVRYLHKQEPRKLYIVTSPFHVTRALASFRGILGDTWELIAHTCPVASDDQSRGAKEQGGIDWTTAFYQDITPGDTSACVQQLLSNGKSAYRSIARLQNFAAAQTSQTSKDPASRPQTPDKGECDDSEN